MTLEQYRRFDPEYANGWYDMHYKDQVLSLIHILIRKFTSPPQKRVKSRFPAL